MSRGITPVIAIVLLLLMAVAAAGGFYFVYQGFTESGEESGSTQIEQLGETSLAALQIESAAGGRIYVKNVGAGEVDLSQVSVYVESVPVEVNRSSDTLAERSRAVLKFTQAPACAGGSCEVKISGAASASRTFDSSKLVCSSNAECYSGESCEGGVCVEGEEEEEEEEEQCDWYSGPGCGDCECGAGEDGTNCFIDCGPRSLLLYNIDPVGMNTDAYSYDWNGSTYVESENVSSDNAMHVFFFPPEYDSEGNALSVGLWGGIDPAAVSWSFFNGTGWSSLQNISDEMSDMEGIPLGWGFNSSNEAIMVRGDADGKNVTWASFDGSSWTEQRNITETPLGTSVYKDLDFTFDSQDRGVAAWASGGGWVNYSVWDGGWGAVSPIYDDPPGSAHEISLAFNSTHVMAVWTEAYSSPEPNDVLKWATWDGSWGPVDNVTDDYLETDKIFLESVGDDVWVLSSTKQLGDPDWIEWAKWDNGWSHQGNLTEDCIASMFSICKNQNGAVVGTFLAGGPTEVNYRFTHWNGTGWEEPVSFER